MKKLILGILVVMMVLSSLSSFAQSANGDELYNDMSACKAVSAEILWKADKMFLEKYKVEYSSIKQPNEVARKAYAELEKKASEELAEDVERYCGN